MVCERHAQHTGNQRASLVKGNPYLQGTSLTSDLFGTGGHPSAVQTFVSPCPVTGNSKATHSKMEQPLFPIPTNKSNIRFAIAAGSSSLRGG